MSPVELLMATDAVVTLTVPPKLFPVVERLTADGRIGAPAKLAWVPVKLAVMFPEDGSGSALRFVSDASTNVEASPAVKRLSTANLRRTQEVDTAGSR